MEPTLAISVRLAAAPAAWGLGGNERMDERSASYILFSSGLPVEATASDRPHGGSSDRRAATAGAQVRPIARSRRLRHWAAKAWVSSFEAPDPSQSSPSSAHGGSSTRSATGSDSAIVRWIASR